MKTGSVFLALGNVAVLNGILNTATTFRFQFSSAILSRHKSTQSYRLLKVTQCYRDGKRCQSRALLLRSVSQNSKQREKPPRNEKKKFTLNFINYRTSSSVVWCPRSWLVDAQGHLIVNRANSRCDWPKTVVFMIHCLTGRYRWIVLL